MTPSNTSGYTGKTKTGSKKSQPKPHKNPGDTKKIQERGIKNTEKLASKEVQKDPVTPKLPIPRTTESKLQWRQVTKKSQRSFSKNKERAYLEAKKQKENEGQPKSPYISKTPPIKPSTGFSKANGGWNKEKSIKPTTRTWDMPGEKRIEAKETNTKPTDTKTVKKPDTKEIKKPKAQLPIPTWEKEIKKVNKKELIDPTMI